MTILETVRSSKPVRQTPALAGGPIHTRRFTGRFPEQADSLQLLQPALAPSPIFCATQRFRNRARLNHGHPWDERNEKAMELLGRMIRSFCTTRQRTSEQR